MNSIDAILKRRSIRKYSDKPISKDDLDLIVKCGLNAPSAVNARPYDIIVVTDKSILVKMALANGRAATLLNDAQAAIMVVGNMNHTFSRAKDYWIVDCSAVVENMLIAATELGIGSCWLGTYPQQDKCEAEQKLFNLPEYMIPHSVIALGYPLSEDEFKEKSENLELDKIHYNKF